MMSKAMSDSLLEKVISRKLLVWLSSCGLMGLGMLDSADWVMISALYIGGQSVIYAVANMKGVA